MRTQTGTALFIISKKMNVESMLVFSQSCDGSPNHDWPISLLLKVDGTLQEAIILQQKHSPGRHDSWEHTPVPALKAAEDATGDTKEISAFITRRENSLHEQGKAT